MATKEKALWFSRHEPTVDQLTGITAMGFELVAVPRGMELGSVNLADWPDAEKAVEAILDLGRALGAAVVFGVYPAPIAALVAEGTKDAVVRSRYLPGAMKLYAAWNVSRAVEGGKPTFAHLRWVNAGWLDATCL